MRMPWMLILLLGGNMCFAQAEFAFQQLPENLGLEEESINCMLQDHKGFLWFGTWSGLVRYDGYTTKVYRQDLNSPYGLKGNKITTLFQDNQQRIWVGTRQTGLHLFDYKTQQFINFSTEQGLSNNNVWSINQGQNGFIWIGTENGLNRLDVTQKRFKVFLEKDGLPSNNIRSIALGKENSIWIATTNGLGLVHTDKGFKIQPYRLGNDPNDIPQHNFIYTIRIDQWQDNILWACTKNGLKKVDITSPESNLEWETFTNGESQWSISHNSCIDIYQERKDRFWVATLSGLNYFDQKEKKFRRFLSKRNEEGGLSNSTIKSLLFSSNNILWVGTNRGVNSLELQPKTFHHFSLGQKGNFDNNIVKAISKGANEGFFWVGTDGGLLNLISLGIPGNAPKIIAQYRLKPKNSANLASFISDIVEDKEGNLWVATHGAGILKVIQPKNNLRRSTLTNIVQFDEYSSAVDLNDSYAMSALEMDDGQLWFGFWGEGLLNYNPRTEEFISVTHDQDSLIDFRNSPNVHLWKTMEDGKPHLWVGTRGNGLLQLAFHDKSLKLIRHFRYSLDGTFKLNSNNINALVKDQNNRIWIGTESGLHYWEEEPNQVIHISKEMGLVDEIIQTITVDQVGHIWVGTKSGLSKIIKNTDSLKIKNYGTGDGLINKFFSDASSFPLENGDIVLGGTQGITYFNPHKIVPDSVPPIIQFTDFKLFNKSVPVGQKFDGRVILPHHISEHPEIILKYFENVVSFEFVGIKYDHPEKIRYAYRLEGFEQDWNYSHANQRIAHYTNLPYRAFTFKVKAENGDKYWSDPIELKLKVLPPFWLSNWAYCVYIFLVLGAIYGIYALTLIRADFVNQLKMEKLERTQMEKMDKLKMQFFTNISHELRTPLTLIITPIEQMLREHVYNRSVQNPLNQIYQQCNKLLVMINQLLDIRRNEVGLMKLQVSKVNLNDFVLETFASFRPVASQKNIQFEFFPSAYNMDTWFDKDQIEKLLVNLLSNAFKFTSREGSIKVEVGLNEEEQLAVVSVQDTGEGIEAKHLPHIFDRFYQVKPGKTPTAPGTGIGLALAKSIIEKHSGTIEVFSERNEGTCFTVKLPLGRNHFSKEEIVSDHYESFLPTDDTVLPKSTNDESIVENPPSKEHQTRLLIVEDSLEIRRFLYQSFSSDYQVELAENGTIGLEKAIANPPDLVISDIAMPEMDGIEFCRSIKTNVQTSHIPLILLTARTSLVFKENGFEQGADDYITKPFNLNLLRIRVRNLIESRAKLRAKYQQTGRLEPSELTVNDTDAAFLEKLIEIIEKEIANSEFSIEHLAKALHISRMQLYRKVKALTDVAPNKLIRDIRLKRAAQLLSQSTFTISEITYMVGFQDLKYFRERFKESFGCSPSKYKQTSNLNKKQKTENRK